MDSSDTIEVLLVSDLHMNHDSMRKLAKWNSTQLPSSTKFDIIFAPGDFDNLTSYQKEADSQEYQKSEADISDLLTHLKGFDAPIYFVPGNHDPYS
jgi:Icc-related predicted phosphoesterase